MGKRNVDASSGSPSSASSGIRTIASAATSAPPPGGPTSVSAVWLYFERDAAGNSVCKFCDRVIKGQHSSNLLSHLRTAGRTDPAHQQANRACEEHRESKRAVKKQKSITPEDLAAVYPQIAAALAKQAITTPAAVASLAGLAVPASVASPLAVKAQPESRSPAYPVVHESALVLRQEQIAQDLGACVGLAVGSAVWD